MAQCISFSLEFIPPNYNAGALGFSNLTFFLGSDMEFSKGSQHKMLLVLDPGPGSKLVFGLAIFMNIWSSETITLPWESHVRPLKLEYPAPKEQKPCGCPILAAQQECLPNSFTPKGSKIWTPSYQSYPTTWYRLVAPYFFPVIKAAVFYMEFWFMTGLLQELGQSYSSAQWAKCQAGTPPKRFAKFGS